MAKFKSKSRESLSKAEQALAEQMIDRFQQRYLAGLGEQLQNIRNVRNLGDGLWEIKSAQGVRVYLDKNGNVLAYGNKASQDYDIPFLKRLLQGEP